MYKTRLTGILWGLKWFAIVALVVFATDMLYVFWPYPDGSRGVEPLHRTVIQEAELVYRLGNDDSVAVIRAIVDGFYHLCFVWTGIDGMMVRFADPSPLSESDEAMRRFFLANWEFLETAVYGLQLFSMRLGVLLLAMPLFLITAIGAIADGLVTWYRRRTSADRESGFIYHRTKRGLALALLALWVVYLLPPVVLDPRYVLPPFLLFFGVTVRFVAAYFKKYL